MGKLIGTARAEVALSADILDYYATHAEAFLNSRAIHESPGAFLETRPLGIILGIEPWNFPYYQIARVAGPQLMVGNVLILKHAENVPQCALAFAQLFELAGAPPGAYTNIFASLNQIGRVIEDSRVCGVTVTGGERAGAAVADPGVAPSSGHSPADAWLGASLGSGCAGMSRASTCSSFKTHHMIPSISRPANPYDNASCESFLSGAATLQFF